MLGEDFIGEVDLNNYFENKQPEIQQVWRTGYHHKVDGYFIWTVLQVIGTPFDEKVFEKCRDGSFIMIFCQHTWNFDTAGALLHEFDSRMQVLEIIEG